MKFNLNNKPTIKKTKMSIAKVTVICSFIFITVCLIHPIDAYVDFFLDANETKTLLGLPGNLFYVYGGELRKSSVNYVIEIPISKDRVEFNWKTSGKEKNFVDYRFHLTSTDNVTNHIKICETNSTGMVPIVLSRFYLQVNCLNNSTDFDFGLNVYFELRNTFQNDIQQLFSMPALNFNISYRKQCTKNKLNHKSLPNSAYNYTLAYIVIGVLFGFSCLFASSGIVMFFHNKIKQRKLHSKYESLHARLNKQHEQTASLTNKHHDEKYQINSSDQLKNSMYTKNTQTNKNKNLYVSKRSNKSSNQQKQLQSEGTNSDEIQNEETQNIYESVQEASVCVNNEINNEEQSIISRKTSRHLLNLTTNTIQSVYNNNAVSASNLLAPKQNVNKNSVELCTKYKREQIEFDRVYMEGTFSKIYEGRLILSETNDMNENDTNTAKDQVYDNFDTSNMQKRNSKRISRCLNFDREKGYMKVLIKTVNDYASLEQTDLMLKESCLFQGLKHKNLNALIGICIEPDFHTLALFPFNEMGNLKIHLNSIRQSRPKIAISGCSKNTENNLITTQEILYIILQMLKALNYLHGKRIIHKDIATRNCWLDANFGCKLADCALSRDLFPNEYHCLANNENKPICWMALETLKENVYNGKTEIWSAGVFMWECFSLGEQPYEQIDPYDLITFLSENESNRLQKPEKCPTELFEIFSNCWNTLANTRPSLKEIFYTMHKLYSNYDNYI